MNTVVIFLHVDQYPVSGCGINPARSFGPAVVMNYWTDHWVSDKDPLNLLLFLENSGLLVLAVLHYLKCIHGL